MARKIEYWVIPPDADGEFVAHMKEVLETYEKAYDPDCPVVCMDEQPVQLIGETRVPIPATKEHPERVDYEYECKGTASIFMFAEPLSGFRQATARPHRTKDDWAHEVAQLLDTRYAVTRNRVANPVLWALVAFPGRNALNPGDAHDDANWQTT